MTPIRAVSTPTDISWIADPVAVQSAEDFAWSSVVTNAPATTHAHRTLWRVVKLRIGDHIAVVDALQPTVGVLAVLCFGAHIVMGHAIGHHRAPFASLASRATDTASAGHATGTRCAGHATGTPCAGHATGTRCAGHATGPACADHATGPLGTAFTRFGVGVFAAAPKYRRQKAH